MSDRTRKIVIIGGVAAGTKTAAKARREDAKAEIVLFTDEKLISYAGCGEPYYIADEIKTKEELLARTAQDFSQANDLQVYTEHRVTKIDPHKNQVEVHDLNHDQQRTESFDILVIATGASPIDPPIPGKEFPGVFKLRTIPDTLAIRERIDSGQAQKAVVVGGGYIGLEMVEALTQRGIQVTLVEQLPQLAPPYDEDLAAHIKTKCEEHGVRVLLNSTLQEIHGDPVSGIQSVTAEDQTVDTDMVLLCVGVRPNVDLAKEAGIELGPTGAIKVNEYLQTNFPHIYAAGDCVETLHMVTGKPVWVPLGSTANKQGRILGMNVTGGHVKFPGVLSTGIFRVFDMAVARTGLIEREAKEEGLDYEAAVVPLSDKPGYMPESKELVVKIIAERGSGRVLGAQVWGPGNVDKVIDTLATAIYFKSTVDQLTELDLAYAPPFAPAMGNVIVAANVLQNKLHKKTEGILPLEVQKKYEMDGPFLFLEVRNPDELERVCFEDYKLIPLPELKECCDELPKDQEIITSCAVGLRAANAYRLLKQRGFTNVKYMDGGIKAFPHPKDGDE